LLASTKPADKPEGSAATGLAALLDALGAVEPVEAPGSAAGSAEAMVELVSLEIVERM